MKTILLVVLTGLLYSSLWGADTFVVSFSTSYTWSRLHVEKISGERKITNRVLLDFSNYRTGDDSYLAGNFSNSYGRDWLTVGYGLKLERYTKYFMALGSVTYHKVYLSQYVMFNFDHFFFMDDFTVKGSHGSITARLYHNSEEVLCYGIKVESGVDLSAGEELIVPFKFRAVFFDNNPPFIEESIHVGGYPILKAYPQDFRLTYQFMYGSLGIRYLLPPSGTSVSLAVEMGRDFTLEANGFFWDISQEIVMELGGDLSFLLGLAFDDSHLRAYFNITVGRL